MLVFIPPTAPLVPPTVRVSHPAHSLFRHYRPWDAGINVWLLPGGVVTTQDPGDGSEVRVFHGGHQHPVDDVEAATLRAAGYSVAEVPDVAPAAPLPTFQDTEPVAYGFGNNFANDFGGPA